ncbi:DUF5677 domain-containing protein [Peribacillus frigoritolerans]|uniref:DUF5677 domain-containing protein n=1 Tax=Peribacillus frigoritolerans TaxID=450367 RepID=UPI001F4F9FAF|nr:DUF5677 domain-containing protein [Peribacillus frigoritolerans]MCK2020786.1 DUF5677 domain-containing protein [Peribacillus frigoritolerans]
MNKQEKIEYARFLIEEVTSKFLLKDTPYIITEGFEYIREVLTLFAKQSNLFESTLVLLENNHAEEAYILLRSMLNNSMLIKYLYNDNEKKERYKNYMIQPVKSQLSFFYDVKKIINKGWSNGDFPELNKKIKEHENILRKEGFTYKDKRTNKSKVDTKLLSIAGLASSDQLLFSHYMMFYKEASKYEHSDFSALDIYRRQIEDFPNTVAFIMDLARTDEELDEKVLHVSITIYSLTFIELLRHINDNHEHLIREENKQYLADLAVIIKNNDFPLHIQK